MIRIKAFRRNMITLIMWKSAGDDTKQTAIAIISSLKNNNGLYTKEILEWFVNIVTKMSWRFSFDPFLISFGYTTKFLIAATKSYPSLFEHYRVFSSDNNSQILFENLFKMFQQLWKDDPQFKFNKKTISCWENLPQVIIVSKQRTKDDAVFL